MTELASALDLFRFLRPWWFLAVPAIFLVWWTVRSRSMAAPTWTANIPSHLLDHLLVNRASKSRLRAVDLAGGMMICGVVAVAGPAWQRIPNPLFSEKAPLVIVLKLSETMLADDVAPSRLERAKMKVLDLVSLRSGARTAIVAYAGSAHLVLPPTDDPRIIKIFVEGLVPSVMPSKGDNANRALLLAHKVLAKEKTSGTVLFVNDGIDPSDIKAFKDYATTATSFPILALVLGTETGGRLRRGDGSFVGSGGGRRKTTMVSPALLARWEAEGDVDIVRSTVDAADIKRLEGLVRSNFQSVIDADEISRWQDEGWWFIWPALIITLVWFRRGWSMQWIWIFIVAGTVWGPNDAHADGLADWFFTPDQQGRFAYEDKRFAEAGARFEDPMWRGVALYDAGRYLEAAEAFVRVQSSDGLFNMGNALVKGREYARAIEAYEQALKEAPDHKAARRNLKIARAILAYLIKVRKAEDTGEQTELGADDYKFDNKEGEGTEIVITGQGKLKLESAEQWMRTVDTQIRDFLRTKFALEAAQGGAK